MNIACRACHDFVAFGRIFLVTLFMSHLILVRHAQAKFFAGDYSRLSGTGEQQARALGAFLAEKKLPFDSAYSGPSGRHTATAERVVEAYKVAASPSRR